MLAFEISRMEGKKENRKRPLEEKEGESGVTQGSGIHRPLEEHIDERFERELQKERGVKILKTNAEKKHDKRLIVILENANLELGPFKILKLNCENKSQKEVFCKIFLVRALTHFLERQKVKNGKKIELLNSDKHGTLLKKMNREIGTARPDITHQTLLALFDSPLNRANLLQVYVRTVKNVLIEINPQVIKKVQMAAYKILRRFCVRSYNQPSLY